MEESQEQLTYPKTESELLVHGGVLISWENIEESRAAKIIFGSVLD